MTISGANPTSYFSAPSTTLDPTLFQGRTLHSWVRKGIVTLLQDFLGKTYRHADLWAHPWLAGSGVSYQWSADRHPGDLDCLVGVSYEQFRKSNPEYRGLSDKEISEQLNESFREELQPTTENWNGYELTFYVNPGATDIRAIKPYAAYDLVYDEWTVSPDPSQQPQRNPEWESIVSSDRAKADQASLRFTAAMNEVNISHNGPARRNAEAKLEASAAQGLALYEEIHGNRSQAFSATGEGYGDFNNYRWQAGKREGTIDVLRTIKEHQKNIRTANELKTYGVELPDANTLIRRAALHRI